MKKKKKEKKWGKSIGNNMFNTSVFSASSLICSSLPFANGRYTSFYPPFISIVLKNLFSRLLCALLIEMHFVS